MLQGPSETPGHSPLKEGGKSLKILPSQVEKEADLLHALLKFLAATH